MSEREQFPSVTVVISVYNKAWIIDKCISSIMEIEYPRWELLLIEQYSTDGSYELLQKYKDRARIIRMGGNYPVALNRALDEVGTPLVAFTDADCTVDRNWLLELVRGYMEEPEIIAVAGFVGTGEGLPLLTTLVGVENEQRYVYWPRYIARAPTMNLLVETDAARRTRFDERLQVALETDFGYRLTKMGRMLYKPEAVVYHYNRTSWRAFFTQQMGYARGAFWVYLRHKSRLRGDHISTFSMIVQIPLFVVGVLFLLLSLLRGSLFYAALICFAALLLIYARDTMRLDIAIGHYPVMFAVFFVRTLGWVVGGLRSLFFFLVKPFGAERAGEKW